MIWFIWLIVRPRTPIRHAIPYPEKQALESLLTMMTSSNGNICRVTGPLWGEITSHWWILLTKASDGELSLICAWINGWVNNREAGDLRRHRNEITFEKSSGDLTVLNNIFMICFFLQSLIACASFPVQCAFFSFCYVMLCLLLVSFTDTLRAVSLAVKREYGQNASHEYIMNS